MAPSLEGRPRTVTGIVSIELKETRKCVTLFHFGW